MLETSESRRKALWVQYESGENHKRNPESIEIMFDDLLPVEARCHGLYKECGTWRLVCP